MNAQKRFEPAEAPKEPTEINSSAAVIPLSNIAFKLIHLQ